MHRPNRMDRCVLSRWSQARGHKLIRPTTQMCPLNVLDPGKKSWGSRPPFGGGGEEEDGETIELSLFHVKLQALGCSGTENYKTYYVMWQIKNCCEHMEKWCRVRLIDSFPAWKRIHSATMFTNHSVGLPVRGIQSNLNETEYETKWNSFGVKQRIFTKATFALQAGENRFELYLVPLIEKDMTIDISARQNETAPGKNSELFFIAYLLRFLEKQREERQRLVNTDI